MRGYYNILSVSRIFIGLCLLLFISSCQSKQVGKWDLTEERQEMLQVYGDKWNEFNVAGDFDSVVSITVPFFQQSLQERDTLMAVWSGIFIAQAYMSMQNLDSVRLYLDRLTPFIADCSNSMIMIAYYSTLGNYELRSRLNYEDAIKYYLSALTWARRAGSVINTVAISYDISYLFYILNDPEGIEYAQDAYALSQDLEKQTPYYSSALAMMGMMSILEGRLEQASCYLDSAYAIVSAGEYSSQNPETDGSVPAWDELRSGAVESVPADISARISGFPVQTTPGSGRGSPPEFCNLSPQVCCRVQHQIWCRR